MKIVYIAEIVGKPGQTALKQSLPQLKAIYQPDFILACADGTTSGFGLGKAHAFTLHKIGLQCLTLGECAFYKKDLHEAFSQANFILRPLNFPAGTMGRGWKVFTVEDQKLAIIAMLGQGGWLRLYPENPINELNRILPTIKALTPNILIDFHACTTAEKQTFFHAFKGRVSAVIGSHSKIQTRDEHVDAAGTAYITDAGRTGSQTSIQGFEPVNEMNRFLSGIPNRSQPSFLDLKTQGLFIDLDETGRAVKTERFSLACSVEPRDD